MEFIILQVSFLKCHLKNVKIFIKKKKQGLKWWKLKIYGEIYGNRFREEKGLRTEETEATLYSQVNNSFIPNLHCRTILFYFILFFSVDHYNGAT